MKILLIQTAFIGDVILATALVESCREHFPDAEMDFLLRKGNERLLEGHPFLRNVLIWDKKASKYRDLLRLLRVIRKERYDQVINCQRFAAAGFLTAFSRAKHRAGFSKNPFSLFFSTRAPHHIGDGTHEVQRNHRLIASWCGAEPARPRLYPSVADRQKVQALTDNNNYVCIAPTSVWFTKQWPTHKWIDLISLMPSCLTVFLLGSKADTVLCAQIAAAASTDGSRQIVNLAGACSFLESAALMQGAVMNYVNDSGPMHLASSVNAPVTAVFCSTVPAFGFGPLSDQSFVVQTELALDCRPCGLHGHARCPKGHFTCAESIDVNALNFPETVLI